MRCFTGTVFFVFVALAAVVFSQQAQAQTCSAPITITAVSPVAVQTICSETSQDSGVWVVDVIVKMPSGTIGDVVIEPTAAAVHIAELRLYADPFGGLEGMASVEVRDAGLSPNSFARIERIVRVPKAPPEILDDVVVNIDISGSLGAVGGGGEVIVTQIDRLRCVGDITFDTITVVEPETSQVEYSEITLVESVNGSIYSDILIPRVGGVPAPDIRVVRVLAENGDIGHAGTGGLVVIESTASVERIQAQNIYAHINAAVDGLHFSGFNGVFLTWSSSGL